MRIQWIYSLSPIGSHTLCLCDLMPSDFLQSPSPGKKKAGIKYNQRLVVMNENYLFYFSKIPKNLAKGKRQNQPAEQPARNSEAADVFVLPLLSTGIPLLTQTQKADCALSKEGRGARCGGLR